MGSFGFLFAWYNVPFVVALGCCVVLALIQVIGGLGDHDADAHADADVDAHVDADIDAHADVDAHLDGDVDVHADVHTGLDGGLHSDAHAAHADSSPLAGALSALGIGRVPLMLVLMLFLGSFGAVGLLANTLLANALGGYPALAFIAILLAGLVLGLWLTSRLGRLFAKLAPNSSTAVTFEQLVGRAGVVVSTSVSPTYGRVQVKDGFGSLHTVFAVIEKGQPLPEHSEVALLAYDAAQRRFIVRGLDRARAR